MSDEYALLIASYLEDEYVEQIRRVSPRLRVIYEPDLLAPPSYPCDHTSRLERTPAQEVRWRALLAKAQILFDFDHMHIDDLPELAPQVRWIQASSAGIGQFVRRTGYSLRMPGTIFTTASGVHARPLAEFCTMALLMLSRGYFRARELQHHKRWERYAATDLEQRTLAIIGVGRIGSAVARIARALGMRVIGTKRRTEGVDPASLALDQLYPLAALPELLRQAEFLVIVAPHTDETEQLIGAEQLALLPRGAALINIGRGALLDEPALIAALQSGHLSGAALDVFATEPLLPESPLWEMPNVLVSPHSASTSDRENQRLTDLFCENLRRFLAGEALLNVLDTKTLY